MLALIIYFFIKIQQAQAHQKNNLSFFYFFPHYRINSQTHSYIQKTYRSKYRRPKASAYKEKRRSQPFNSRKTVQYDLFRACLKDAFVQLDNLYLFIHFTLEIDGCSFIHLIGNLRKITCQTKFCILSIEASINFKHIIQFYLQQINLGQSIRRKFVIVLVQLNAQVTFKSLANDKNSGQNVLNGTVKLVGRVIGLDKFYYFYCAQTTIKRYSQQSTSQLILISSKMQTHEKTTHKTPNKSTGQKYNPSAAPAIVQRLMASIKKFYNPYVIMEIGQQILRWDLKSTIELNIQSSIQKQQKQTLIKDIKRAASDIYSLYKYYPSNKKQIQQLLKYRTKELIEQFLKYREWQGAYIMLNSQAVRRLDLRFTKELIQLFQEKKYKEIHTFFKDTLYKSNLIKEAQFQNYIRNKKIFVRNVALPLKNFEQLIRWIKKTAPAQNLSSTILIQKLKRGFQLQGSIIDFSDPDPQKAVNGKVIKAQYKDKKVYLKLKRTKDHINLQVQLDDKEKGITQVKVEQFEFIPLQALVRIENKKHWQIFQKTKNKTTFLIKQNCQIQLNNSVIPTVLITPGFYNIYCQTYVQNDPQLYELYFKEKSSEEEPKQYRMQVAMKASINQKTLSFENKRYLYTQFTRSYEIRQSKTYYIFNEGQNIENSLKIQKYFNSSDNTYLYQKLSSIQEKKNRIIRSLKYKRFQDSPVFQQFILKGQIDAIGIKRIGISKEINQIICDYSQIEQSTSEEQLVKQLFSNFNYASFVPKYETLKSISMINHFVNSQRAVEQMIGKDIIALLGNTGSGKSTTADYLIGVPLKESRNCYGDKIIEIDQQQAKKEKLVTSSMAKIGHSCVLSQTIYSRGHSILNKKGQEINSNKNVIICDNPGFSDTRGLFFQVCTRLSMDRAFYLCNSISKVVLILPEQIIKSQKSIHLINIISQIYERFEPLSDNKSEEFNSFYIFITKSRQSYQKIENLEAYIKGTLSEYKSHLSQMSSKYGINEQANIMQKINIFTNLLKMIEEQRIIYLHVTSEVDRIDILFQLGALSDSDSKTSLVKQNHQLKNKYKKCLDDKYLRQFAHQVSIAAHTLAEVILKEYLYQMPAKIQQIKSQISKIHKAINKHLQGIEQAKRKIRQKEQLKSQKEQIIYKNKQAISQIMSNKTTEFQKFIKQSKMKEQTRKSQKMSIFQMKSHQLNDFKTQANKITANIVSQEKKLHELYAKTKQISEQIQRWKTSVVTEEIYAVSFSINQIINIRSQRKTFKVGQQALAIKRLLRLTKDYILLPNAQFDQKNLISKAFTFGKYKATVQSRGHWLQSIKPLPDGGKQLSIITNFKPTKSKQELPYLRITYELPGKENYKDAIRNKSLQLTRLFRQIYQLQSDIQSSKRKETMQKNMIGYKEKNLKLQMQSRQKFELIKLKKNYKQQHQKSILHQEQQLKSIQSSIIQYSNQIKDHDNQIIDLKKALSCKCKQSLQNNYFMSPRNSDVKQQNISALFKRASLKEDFNRQSSVNPNEKVQKACQCSKLQEKLAEKQWMHRRMAFLIKDQFNKKIPQTLKKFIDFTQILKMQNAEYKTTIFANFKKIFDKQEATLLKRVKQHLKQS